MSRLERELAAIREALETVIAQPPVLTDEELAAEEEALIQKTIPVIRAAWPYLERGEQVPDEVLRQADEHEDDRTEVWEYLPDLYQMSEEGYFDPPEDEEEAAH